MNFCLKKYKNFKKIWHISGWSFDLNRNSDFDIFFSKNMQAWGWATWKDRWKFFEKKPQKLISYFNKNKDRIYKFYQNKQIQLIGEKYTGYKIKNLMTMANRVIYKKNNEGSGGGWHKDAYYNQFKSILYLNDVNNENGPFELIEKSNKIFDTLKIALKLCKGYPNTRFSDKEVSKLDKIKIKRILGSAGTLILVDTSLIHRGLPLKSSIRYSITNYYSPEDIYENFKQFLPKFSFNQ